MTVFIPDNAYGKVKPLVRIAKGLILGDKPSLLDVGCGEGKVYRDLEDKVDYFGIDINEDKIKPPVKSAKIPPDRCACENLFETDRIADYVLCSRVINHLDTPDWPKAMEKLLSMARINLFVIASPGDASKKGLHFIFEGYLVNFRPISWFDTYEPLVKHEYKAGIGNTHVLLVFRGLHETNVGETIMMGSGKISVRS